MLLLQDGPESPATAFFRRAGSIIVVFVDPHTGEVLGDRVNLSAPLIPIGRLHTGTVAGRPGRVAVGIFTLVMGASL